MSELSLLSQINNFTESHCYQYQRRLDTLDADKIRMNLSDDDVRNISLSDFKYKFLSEKWERDEATEFIERYEWLGTVGNYPTHWFGAYWKGVLGGVVIMSMPNAFSKILGEETKSLERLISRGASASWTPFNLGSNFLSWCIRWMVHNTQYRLFTCYSDPLAKEQGSIYQALNFYYLGCNSGASIRCVNPYNPSKIVSDRTFRARSFYKKYAKDLGIQWDASWNSDQKIHWENIPIDVADKLRQKSKEMYEKSVKIKFPNKHKYCYVLGRDKKETKELRKRLLKNVTIYPYPKNRGECDFNDIEIDSNSSDCVGLFSD